MYHDLTSGQTKTIAGDSYGARDNDDPCIWGTKIIYTKAGDYYGHLCVKDLSTGVWKQLTTQEGSRSQLMVSQGRLVYRSTVSFMGSTMTSMINLYDFATNEFSEVSELSERAYSPSISGSQVAWVVETADGTKLCYKDLSSGTRQRQFARADETAMSSSKIFYSSKRSENSDIYVVQPNFPSLRPTTPSVITYNTPAKVTGTFVDGAGVPIVGKTVRLEHSADAKTWQSGATTTTAAGGAYSLYSPPLTKARYVRVSFTADSDYRGCVGRHSLVKPRIFFASTPSMGKTKLQSQRELPSSWLSAATARNRVDADQHQGIPAGEAVERKLQVRVQAHPLHGHLKPIRHPYLQVLEVDSPAVQRRLAATGLPSRRQ